MPGSAVGLSLENHWGAPCPSVMPSDPVSWQLCRPSAAECLHPCDMAKKEGRASCAHYPARLVVCSESGVLKLTVTCRRAYLLLVKQAPDSTPSTAVELAAASGAVAAAEAEHAPTPVQLLAASVTGGAPAPTLSASVASLPDAGQMVAGAPVADPAPQPSCIRVHVSVSHNCAGR